MSHAVDIGREGWCGHLPCFPCATPGLSASLYPNDTGWRRRRTTRLLDGVATVTYGSASPIWATMAPIEIARVARVFRADGLAETIRGFSLGSVDYLEEVVGRCGVPVSAGVNAGPTVKARMKIATWDLPIYAETAVSGTGSLGDGPLYASQENRFEQFTEVLGEPMLSPEDALGPITADDESWTGVGPTFAQVAKAGAAWPVATASELTRGKYRICGAQEGDKDGTDGLGRLRQARYTVRTVERNAANVIVSDASVVRATALDAALGMQATEEVAVEPTAPGHTVAVTVTLVEMLGDDGATWGASSPVKVGVLTRTRTGVWGFAGGREEGDPVLYYRRIRGLSRRQYLFHPETPPDTYEPPAWGERGENPSNSDLKVEEHATLMVGADGARRWHTTLRLHGTLHGRDFSYEADFGLRSAHLTYASTAFGVTIPAAATAAQFVASDMLNQTTAFLPTTIIGGGWVIPGTIPDGSTITETRKGTDSQATFAARWQDNVVVVGVPYPARVSWTYLDQEWTRVSGGEEGHAYIAADTTTLTAPADNQMILCEWWGLLGAAAEF